MKKIQTEVSVQYLERAAEILHELKSYTDSLLLSSGKRNMLEVGCGSGIDTVRIAQRLPAGARIHGIDRDPEMIKAARFRAFTHGVDHAAIHQVADATALPFEAGIFDAIRSERVFQHLSAPAQRDAVLAESLRVLGKGGLAIISDTDWASASLDYPDPDMERKMLAFYSSNLVTNGFSGRELFRLFRENGLKNVQVRIFPVHFADLAYTPFGTFLVREARSARLFSGKRLDQWLQILNERNEKGLFYCSLNMVVVSGTQ